jgi:hypothetical protein
MSESLNKTLLWLQRRNKKFLVSGKDVGLCVNKERINNTFMSCKNYAGGINHRGQTNSLKMWQSTIMLERK